MKFRRREMEMDQAKTLARIAREVGEPLPERHVRSKLPGDPLALRGIPAIGRSVSGCIRHTNPEAEAMRRVPSYGGMYHAR